MTTARDIIEAASRKIHVLGRGEVLSADEAQDGLDMLNGLLASLSVEGGMVYADSEETFTLTNAQSYSIGSGGDFDTTVPYKVNAVTVSNSNIDYILDSISREEYASISLKSTGSMPQYYYFDCGFPLSNISLYPVATSGYTITINSNKRLTEFSNLTDDFVFPPEYKRMLINNLAIELAPDYEKEPSMAVVKVAHDSKMNVFSANTRNDEMVSVPAYGMGRRGGFNVYKGNN